MVNFMCILPQFKKCLVILYKYLKWYLKMGIGLYNLPNKYDTKPTVQ